MLTRYDEYPVHQAPYTFARIPVTDYSWDDGHFVGAFSADEKAYLCVGFRVNPNADMIGGWAMLNIAGRQYTVRFSRCWRRQVDTVIGPLSFDFFDPMKALRAKLDANDSALTFDFTWTGVSPAFEESHHFAETRGRITTDQTRYSQPGQVAGFIEFEGKRYDMTSGKWCGARDHSWGLYSDRKPLGGYTEWLPPVIHAGVPRAFHLWSLFQAGEWSGFYNLNESATGEQGNLNDFHGTPFEGAIHRGWSGETLRLTAARHEIRFKPGTRVMSGGTVYLTDERGGQWQQNFEVASPPWLFQMTGYTPGSWKDGGTLHTYHGNEELALEWDDFDFSDQPVEYRPYPSKHGNADNAHYDSFKIFSEQKVHGVEYVARNEIIAPDGSRHVGQAHMENFLFGRFDRYGFK